MKALILLLIPIFSFCQSPVNSNGKIEYTEVVSVDSAKAADLFSRSKLYITNAFKSGKDVTQLVDDETKTIVGKGVLKIYINAGLGIMWDVYVHFKTTIQCRDGRYKYSLTEFEAELIGGSTDALEEEKPKSYTKKMWASLKEQTNSTINEMIIDLKKQMSSTKNDAW